MDLDVDPAALAATATALTGLSEPIAAQTAVLRAAGAQASGAAGHPRLAAMFTHYAEQAARRNAFWAADMNTFRQNLRDVEPVYRAQEERAKQHAVAKQEALTARDGH